MSGMRTCTAIVLLSMGCGRAIADELVLLPASATLDGPKAAQRFLVEARAGNAFVADRTKSAAFATDDPKVASVSPDGTVTPRGNGATTLTVIADGRVARAKARGAINRDK